LSEEQIQNTAKERDREGQRGVREGDREGPDGGKEKREFFSDKGH